MLVKLRDEPGAIDAWLNRQMLPEIRGNAGMPDLTPEEWEPNIAKIVQHVRPELADKWSYGEAVPNDAVFNNLRGLDGRIGDSIEFILSREAPGKAQGHFHRILAVWMVAQMLNPKAIYSCYDGYDARHHED